MSYASPGSLVKSVMSTGGNMGGGGGAPAVGASAGYGAGAAPAPGGAGMKKPGEQEPDEERRGRWRQGVERAKERIRTATGQDGNGLKDAARQISETVRAKMGGIRSGLEGGGFDPRGAITGAAESFRNRVSGSIAGRAAEAESKGQAVTPATGGQQPAAQPAAQPATDASALARDKIEKIKSAAASIGAKAAVGNKAVG